VRAERISGEAQGDLPQSGTRSAYQRDRDRILYSDYFRRLAGVTQVASAVDSGVFHNRLLHSLKVAQVGRRLAERLLQDHPDLEGEVEPDVVEAACLAHDLGHPPFGHVADHKLCALAEEMGLPDGFEGNAQTFRILSRLAIHSGIAQGVDLTRATLAATLKYPWRRARPSDEPYVDYRRKKYSVYDDDVGAFEFARLPLISTEKSIEAQIMDIADSITYSVHDLEDFFRAGLIPIEKIARNEEYRGVFLERWKIDKPENQAQKHFQDVKSFKPVKALLNICIVDDDDPGSHAELRTLEVFRSTAITRFLKGVTFESSSRELQMETSLEHQTKFLQRLVWDYVILNPKLATQQAGQVRIVECLVRFFHEAIVAEKLDRLPMRFQSAASACPAPEAKARFAIDIVASLSEAEAIRLFKRITGLDTGSLLDPAR